MEKTKKKKKLKAEEDPLGLSTEQEKLRKRVTDMLKKQKLRAVRHIVEGHDDTKPWDEEIRAKVCGFFL